MLRRSRRNFKKYRNRQRHFTSITKATRFFRPTISIIRKRAINHPSLLPVLRQTLASSLVGFPNLWFLRHRSFSTPPPVYPSFWDFSYRRSRRRQPLFRRLFSGKIKIKSSDAKALLVYLVKYRKALRTRWWRDYITRYKLKYRLKLKSRFLFIRARLLSTRRYSKVTKRKNRLLRRSKKTNSKRSLRLLSTASLYYRGYRLAWSAVKFRVRRKRHSFRPRRLALSRLLRSISALKRYVFFESQRRKVEYTKVKHYPRFFKDNKLPITPQQFRDSFFRFLNGKGFHVPEPPNERALELAKNLIAQDRANKPYVPPEVRPQLPPIKFYYSSFGFLRSGGESRRRLTSRGLLSVPFVLDKFKKFINHRLRPLNFARDAINPSFYHEILTDNEIFRNQIFKDYLARYSLELVRRRGSRKLFFKFFPRFRRKKKLFRRRRRSELYGDPFNFYDQQASFLKFHRAYPLIRQRVFTNYNLRFRKLLIPLYNKFKLLPLVRRRIIYFSNYRGPGLLAQGFKNRVGNLSARKRVVHRVFKHYLLRLGRRRPYLQRKRIRRIRYIIKRARSRHRKYLLWRLRDRLIGAFNRRNQKSYGYPRVSPIKRPVRLSKRQKKKKSAQKKLLRKALAISIRKKFYTKHSKIKAVRLVLTQTRNNFFFSVQTTWGKVRLVYTNGRTNFKGSRRYSYVATEEAGSNISKFLRSRGVKNFYIIFKSRFTTFCRAGFFGLISRLRCKRAFLRLLVPHNGLRKRSSRRV